MIKGIEKLSEEQKQLMLKTNKLHTEIERRYCFMSCMYKNVKKELFILI